MKLIQLAGIALLLTGCSTGHHGQLDPDLERMRTAPNLDWIDAMRRGEIERPGMPDIPSAGGGFVGNGGGNNGGGNGNGNNGNGQGGGNNGNGQGNGGGNGTGNEGGGKGPK